MWKPILLAVLAVLLLAPGARADDDPIQALRDAATVLNGAIAAEIADIGIPADKAEKKALKSLAKAAALLVQMDALLAGKSAPDDLFDLSCMKLLAKVFKELEKSGTQDPAILTAMTDAWFVIDAWGNAVYQICNSFLASLTAKEEAKVGKMLLKASLLHDRAQDEFQAGAYAKAGKTGAKSLKALVKATLKAEKYASD